MNARIRPGLAVGFKAMSEDRRERAKRKPPRKLRSEPGKSLPDYSGGLPAEIETGTKGKRRFTHLKVTSHPYQYLKPDGLKYEAADLTGLAMHLSSELQSYVRNGTKLPPQQVSELKEILLLYARQQQESHSRDVGWKLMWLSARLALSKTSAEKAIGLAAAIREQTSWTVSRAKKPGQEQAGGTVRVTAHLLEELATNGRKSHENKAIELYRLLAEGSEALPLPQEKVRRENAAELRHVLETCLGKARSEKPDK